MYYAINPVSSHSGLALRGKHNVALSRVQAASDADIAYRSTILIDVDPVRPTGTASTEAEKTETEAATRTVRAYLSARGWPEPALLDSGNGCHLLYRTHLPAVYPHVSMALRVLAKLHDTDTAHVDTCVHNAARISRLPYTYNKKGDNTPDRPHRMAKLVEAGDDFLVDEEKVAMLASLWSESAEKGAPARISTSISDQRAKGVEYRLTRLEMHGRVETRLRIGAVC